MGKMALIVRVTPKENTTVEEVIDSIKKESFEEAELKDIRKEPLAFGIFIIKAMFLLPEKADQLTNKIIEKLKALENIDNAEIEGMTLV